MANKITGYFKNVSDVLDKRIFGRVSAATAWGASTYKIGESNDATKFAFIAQPISGSGSSREYGVYLWCNSTVTSGASNYVHYYMDYSGSISDVGNGTNTFGSANDHGYRSAPMGIPYSGTILLDSNNLPTLVDDNNVVNVYDGDAPSSYNDPDFSAFLDAVFDHPAIPPRGQGTVTINIPANGQTLTFTSSELSTSVTQLIDGDAVVDIEEPPSTDLIIFENGQFSNVINGFDISQYKSSGSSSINNLSQYFGTSWGLVQEGDSNSGRFAIDANNCLSREAIVSSGADIEYFIPIQQASGYTKLVFEFKFTSLSYRADAILCSARAVVNNAMTKIGGFEPAYNTYRPTDFTEFEFNISQENPVDYITVGGDLGGVSFKSIKLVK